MVRILFFILTMNCLLGCAGGNEVNIRLSNISQYDFTNIVVNTSTGDTHFDDLISGKKSEYKQFSKAYKYAFIALKINGETYTLQPIDYIGERSLKRDNYTYQINADTAKGRYGGLRLTLIKG